MRAPTTMPIATAASPSGTPTATRRPDGARPRCRSSAPLASSRPIAASANVSAHGQGRAPAGAIASGTTQITSAQISAMNGAA